jgi:hypothetical protein
MMQPLDGLFEADGDQQAHGDRRDVHQEILPQVGSGVERVNVEHQHGTASCYAAPPWVVRFLRTHFVTASGDCAIDELGPTPEMNKEAGS